MPLSSSKYRMLLSRLLLGFYVFGVVQMPSLELLHLISHSIVDHGHGGIHSYADHQTTDDHSLLITFDTSEDDSNNHHRTIETPVDKIEYLVESNHLSNLLSTTQIRPQIPSPQLTGIILDIPCPPPKPI